ncbi:hypothetical protein ACFQE8_10075 [Salinirubellus sp. GCM10025818]|jgi:small-conductance mechanosensitive channel|uniref:hypothetical protein n=1 Tax=Salinirubellus TaxID=2162630 RepID=UPI0030D546BA
MTRSTTGTEFATVASGAVAQVDTIGGSTPTAVAAVVVFFVALGLSVLVTYRYARGYLRTRRRPLLHLTVGLLLLAPAPMFVRLVLGNVAVATATERTFVVTVSKLCGLLVILSVVHRS